MSRPINQDKVLEEKTEVKQYILFNESKSSDLTLLLEIYAINPYKARVLYVHNSYKSYIMNRRICFERLDGSFEICNFVRKFGMSKTNRIYSRETKESSLIYKAGKFYFKQGKLLKHASYETIKFNFAYSLEYLLGKFPWLRNIVENEQCHGISLSTIVKYKLFNSTKIHKHVYKVPKNVVDILLRVRKMYDMGGSRNWDFYWKKYHPYLINVESLTFEFLTSHIFHDTMNLAIKLGYKVNCSWSKKRLKHEHDEWSKELTKIILEFEPLIDLNPFDVYEKFEEFSGYRLLRTNHDLIEEGNRMNHCVGGYSSNIINGSCGIFQVSGYTLQISYRVTYEMGKVMNNGVKSMVINQLRGYKNCDGPKELEDEVDKKINEFNQMVTDGLIKIGVRKKDMVSDDKEFEADWIF